MLTSMPSSRAILQLDKDRYAIDSGHRHARHPTIVNRDVSAP